jgi:large subunit ribosomal protein L13
MKTHTIDATNMKLGRVASQAAKLLMGKDSAQFVKNAAPSVRVHITNASKISVTEKKRNTFEYTTYSGHPGGIKVESMDNLIRRRGFGELFRRAVSGMLPKNKLHKEMMKHLEITE